MEADVIKMKIEDVWSDVSSHWRDEYAARYRAVVIMELENTLDSIRNVSMQLSNTVDEALLSLREFDD